MVGLLEETITTSEEHAANQPIKKNNIKNGVKILEKQPKQQQTLMEIDVDENGKVKNVEVVQDRKISSTTTSTTTSEPTSTTMDNTDDPVILENVKLLLDEVLNLVENSLNENGDVDAEGENSSDMPEEEALHHKGILKHERNYPNKHVDFDLALQYIPFDPKKDYTIDIQFVETIKKRVVSYAALYAQKKEEEEETVQAAAAAALQEPTSAATDEHTKLMDAADTNGVSVKSE
ncbi:uncharacterized protein isoform X1 [Rhodnius prolixus]|uniref:uncharacterized protein isoform X1 n=1 Tax=Rhodnius prolixus TaxID=13249 RepID=UPI003D18C1FE